jgi:hypothetical protein
MLVEGGFSEVRPVNILGGSSCQKILLKASPPFGYPTLSPSSGYAALSQSSKPAA